MTENPPASLILASASPRRRELLSQLGIVFDVRPADVDETPYPGESPESFVLRMAQEKARAGWEAQPPLQRLPVLGADTSVVLDGAIYGKPKDRAEGLAMLAALSGRSHRVYSAVAWCRGDIDAVVNVSVVTFRKIDPWERAAYWATGEPADKAGGYGIQGLGAVFVSRLEGSYSGVMGLPLFETAQLLVRNGMSVFRGPSV